MKLYLSSYRLGDHSEKLAEMFGKNKKIAVIANAADYHSQIERDERVKENIESLKALGLDPVELDLREYFGKSAELAKKMSEFGAVFVRGGNSFLLRRAFAQSGFDKWLTGQKDNKEFVYAGYSAGGCILSPDLRGLEIVDDPNVLAPGYDPEIIWKGLNLIDFAFAPHFESNHPESAGISETVEYYKKNNIPFKALRDGEVIITET
jgi:dipeptidase E